jgi:hypothetical protein
MRVRTIDFLGQPIPRDGDAFYFLCLLVLVGSILLALNLLRSPTGRAFIAIRDSETAAKSMGIDLAGYKVKSFAISAALTGMAGVLFAHKMSFISPEMFTLLLSIEFIMVIIIGGAFGVHGAVLGAIFIVMVDPFLTTLKDDVPVLGASLATTLGMAPDARLSPRMVSLVLAYLVCEVIETPRIAATVFLTPMLKRSLAARVADAPLLSLLGRTQRRAALWVGLAHGRGALLGPDGMVDPYPHDRPCRRGCGGWRLRHHRRRPCDDHQGPLVQDAQPAALHHQRPEVHHPLRRRSQEDHRLHRDHHLTLHLPPNNKP